MDIEQERREMNEQQIILTRLDRIPGVTGWHIASALAIYRREGLYKALAWIGELGNLKALMSCGHPRAALRYNVHATAATTHFCALCLAESQAVTEPVTMTDLHKEMEQ